MSDTTDCDTDWSRTESQDAVPFGLDPGPEPEADAEVRFRGHVEEYDDAPDEYTVFPETPSDTLPRMTAWITAAEGSYCSLEESR